MHNLGIIKKKEVLENRGIFEIVRHYSWALWMKDNGYWSLEDGRLWNLIQIALKLWTNAQA